VSVEMGVDACIHSILSLFPSLLGVPPGRRRDGGTEGHVSRRVRWVCMHIFIGSFPHPPPSLPPSLRTFSSTALSTPCSGTWKSSSISDTVKWGGREGGRNGIDEMRRHDEDHHYHHDEDQHGHYHPFRPLPPSGSTQSLHVSAERHLAVTLSSSLLSLPPYLLPPPTKLPHTNHYHKHNPPLPPSLPPSLPPFLLT